MYKNTYDVFVIKKEHDDFKVVYKHTCYQLWESAVKGFLSTQNNDFIILNRDGINFIRLDPKTPRKSISDIGGTNRMVHSLGSMNYLKVEPLNLIGFENNLDKGDVYVNI